MPSATTSKLEFVPMHETFVAEVRGIDFTKPLSPEVVKQVQDGIDKYGILVFRNTGLDDKSHIAFARHFGPLDDMLPHVKAGRKLRLPDPEMFDVSNLDPDGNLVTEADPARLGAFKGNALWHADLAFNSPRAGYSMLRAHQLPPKGLGGDTQYCDARTAYEDLPEEMKAKIANLVGNHSLMHNRKLAAPELYPDLNPRDYPFSKHRLVVPHKAGRTQLYLTTYLHHFDGMTDEESQQLMDELWAHCTQPQYTVLVKWENDGDLIMWDNTAVLHRATGGEYLTKHVRDMRRTTSHDDGPHGLGMNKESFRQGLPIPKVP
ncbi:hypothetical protein GE09DRAFT_1158770 [Coniochaeta sp. 2T2.1]|nr:hypothetical protein GE09DRAFT_1158770 [Coniochaeta sp. 2T2.1]